MFLASALKDSAANSIRRRIRKPAQCAVCADLDIRDVESWSTGSQRGRTEAFDHLLCTRSSISRGDLVASSEAGCTVCAAFLAAVADVEGDKISIRLLPDKDVEVLLGEAKRHRGNAESIEHTLPELGDLYGPLGKCHTCQFGSTSS